MLPGVLIVGTRLMLLKQVLRQPMEEKFLNKNTPLGMEHSIHDG
jgi:hypothetical protein